MAIAPGTRIGSYEVTALIGAGGMGEVYRATDTNLGRQVAIKVLPDTFAHDSDRLARFEREAKTLASLNHPNIAQIYGLEKTDGVRALVMELVEGPTLADRIAHGAIPVDEALPIAKQIAEALEAAHEQSIIHRDLKPGNVKVRPDGVVKVLDFGLAKALDPVGSAVDVSQAPTIASPAMMTGVGVLLGTAAYMSPEQARGKAVDKRADIWAFGCVLYEMLTGKRAFGGETVSETLADVMKSEPRWAALPPDTPARIRNIVRRCLEKDLRQRVRDIGDVRLALEGAFETTLLQAAPPVRVPQWRRVAVASAVAVIAGAVLAGAAVWFAMRPAPPPTAPLAITRFPLTLPEGQDFTNPNRRLVAISPDGTQMVYVANQRLYLRSMWELDARPIPGTEIGGAGVTNPVFSPDGRSIVYLSQADMTLKRIAVSGGAAVTICPADNPFGMSWGADGLVFGQGSKGVMRVSPTGGKPELLVSVKGDEVAHGPQMLPDGQTVLFTLATGTAADRWDKAHLVVQSLRSGERKTLIEGGSDARYLPTGHLVYALGGVVFGVPFDLTRLVVTGEPVAIVEGVRRAIAPTTGTAQFSVSDTGSLMYVPGPASAATSQSDLGLIDRKGAVEPLKLPPGPYQFPRVSPNGKRVVFATDDGNEAIVWIYELAGASSMRRLTFGGKNRFPIWSADGERVAFQSDREGDLGIFWQRADGTGTAERLTKSDQGTGHVPESWSPKGERFLFGVTKGSNVSLWVFSLQDKKATPFGAVQSSVSIASMFSPDGRWVAYASTEAGGNEIYVQPFPSTGAKYQISKNRGSVHPVWSPDGKELFYMPGAGEFGVVSVTTQPSVTLGNLVPVPRPFVFLSETAARNYDITPDGKRFVGVVAADQTQSGAPATRQIQVVLNWHEELKRLVPVR